MSTSLGRLTTLNHEVKPGSTRPARAPQGLRDARERLLDTGLRHGFLYRPLPEWVEPVVAWLR